MGNDYCTGIKCNNKNNRENNREKLFELFILSRCNIEIFIEMINIINKNNITNHKNLIFNIPNNFIKKWYSCRNIYNNVDIINPSNINIKMKKPNYKNLRKFLENYDFRNDIIEHISTSLKNLYSYFESAIIINNNKNYNENYNENYNDWVVVKKK
jgi:hypothetical protein